MCHAVLNYYDSLLLVTLVNCDGVVSGLGVTNWMVCLCTFGLSDIQTMPGCYSNMRRLAN